MVTNSVYFVSELAFGCGINKQDFTLHLEFGYFSDIVLMKFPQEYKFLH